MKKLKLEAVEVWDGYVIRIVEQTHRNSEFGNGGSQFISSDGFKLDSWICPEFVRDNLYVRGSNEKKDKTNILVGSDNIERIKKAVSEYNEAFSDAKMKSGVVVIE